ncbi:hypothetical protein ASD50_15190 [Mesorhizobium sp. Root552]|nr:hypothetical protein ASD50_15190 [Mesorhizobium sp. Root552]
MNTNDATRATARALPDIFTALDILNRAWSQVELINMAAEASNVTGEAGNAIAWGCISVQEQLDQVKALLNADDKERGDGTLTKMLVVYEAARDRINKHDDNATVEDVGEDLKSMTGAALRIIGYRAVTKFDQRRRAKFLAEYTDGTMLTEAEQDALVASLMPEGGAA